MSLLERELSNVDVTACLKTIEYRARFNGRCVDVTLSYIPFRNGRIDTGSFLALIKDYVIVKFILTYKEIRKHYQRKDKLLADKDLFDKAIRKISRSTAKGKLGELLLYLFLEKFMGAPKILSKISRLDDPNTHVKGADAVHAQYKGNTLLLYLGESKLWKQYAPACTDAVQSIRTTLDHYQEEFDLIESDIDFPNMNHTLEEEIIRLLNPYSNPHCSETIYTPCLIGFDSRICRSVSSESRYCDNYRSAAQNIIDTFYRKAEGHLDISKVPLILLPFASIDDFAEEFIRTLGIS